MNNGKSYIDEYTSQDERFNQPGVKAELIANHGLDFERVVKIGKGTRTIHQVNINGIDVPMRLLSMEETAKLQHQTIIDMKTKYPEFKGLLYNLNFERIFNIKQISRATTVCKESANCKEIPDTRYFTEDEISGMTAVEFASLLNAYIKLEADYNPVIDEISEESIVQLMEELCDPEKKSITIAGLTSAQMSKVLEKTYEMLIKLEENTSIIKSLQDMLSINEDEKTLNSN